MHLVFVGVFVFLSADVASAEADPTGDCLVWGFVFCRFVASADVASAEADPTWVRMFVTGLHLICRHVKRSRDRSGESWE